MDDLTARAVTFVYDHDPAVSHRWLAAVCAAYGGEAPIDLAEFTQRLKAAEHVDEQTVDGFMVLLGDQAGAVLAEIWQAYADLPGLFSRACAQLWPDATASATGADGDTHWDEANQQWWVMRDGQWVVRQDEPTAQGGPATDAPAPPDAADVTGRIADLTRAVVAELRSRMPEATSVSDEELTELAGRLVAAQLGV
jgi:hypothetical protein